MGVHGICCAEYVSKSAAAGWLCLLRRALQALYGFGMGLISVQIRYKGK